MLFNNVLVPYDGTEQSRKALESAIDMLRLNPAAKLFVLHVYDFKKMYMADSVLTVPVSVNMEQYEIAEQIVEEAKQRVASLANETHVELQQGTPAQMILEFGKKHAIDFIVIGSRGLRPIGEWVLGSVSHHVVQHTQVPVLVIK
ncbi:universal stress protein [Paenibacillus sp. GCM10027629]|uniref:universal stress protein n=1 Tax=Paenibacillus sp. GCM10027629 TaxID=3273414 RepID=UPI00362D3CDE